MTKCFTKKQLIMYKSRKANHDSVEEYMLRA